MYAGKYIKRITFFSSDDATKDYRGYDLVPRSFFDGLYVNIYSEDKREIFKDMCCANLLAGVNLITDISDKINYDLSGIAVLSDYSALTPGQTYAIVCTVEYDERIISVEEPTNVYTVTIPTLATKTFYNFREYTIESLKEFVIKRIVAKNNTNFYLTIRNTNGNVYNEIPGALLAQNKFTFDVMLPNVRMDVYNTFIELPDPVDGEIVLEIYY